jgi:hypothetical protein
MVSSKMRPQVELINCLQAKHNCENNKSLRTRIIPGWGSYKAIVINIAYDQEINLRLTA